MCLLPGSKPLLNMTGWVQADRASSAWGIASTETLFNTSFCFSTKIFLSLLLIQCTTPRQRALNVFRQKPSSFGFGQWQMRLSSRSKTACPGQTTELWSACKDELLLQRANQPTNKLLQHYFHFTAKHCLLQSTTHSQHVLCAAEQQGVIIMHSLSDNSVHLSNTGSFSIDQT